ncbi:MAG TPA: RMD1 family protein [Polyangiales bacterium]|nr:RMD1 family protein [Polyangiales bacterium]
MQIRALLLGSRLGPPGSENWPRIADRPLVLAAPSGGCATLFRYGALVLFGVSAEDERQLIQDLVVREPLARPETETVEMRLERAGSSRPPRIDEGTILVPDENIQRLQIIAEALAKSVVLAHYESTIAGVFDRIEPLAQNLNDRGRGGRVRELLEHIGTALLSEHRMVARVEVREKPEALWDNAELERFYPQLDREYELRDRAVALERKLDLISRTARTAFDLVQQRSYLRVEWYIVALIVVEILLTLYTMLWGR